VTANDGLRRALENLSETDREMILLKAWDGLSDADIAHVMGISAPAVAVRVTRVREKMMLTLDGSLSRNSEPPSDSSSVEQGDRS
jgi:RNA polymerase sigma-70 factor (ECF subfamily)